VNILGLQYFFTNDLTISMTAGEGVVKIIEL
jgi:hypothetical protein